MSKQPNDEPNDRHAQCGEHRMFVESLTEIKDLLRDICKELKEGATSFATIETRLVLVERIVFGAAGLALLSIAGAILSFVIRR